ncbi:Restriction endonuclease [Desulfitobacterium hafniense]|uniref:Restriction endonuclease n=1 Tax=Desulfitobacterium hafniense TaxID=49338 RepID=A0A098AZ04_DESHA|nr:restriction endonuclease [Desulfitobacterium hafniense]CDX00851.1 Restriction endonuclease [Desulfitobacterium hafniense]
MGYVIFLILILVVHFALLYIHYNKKKPLIITGYLFYFFFILFLCDYMLKQTYRYDIAIFILTFILLILPFGVWILWEELKSRPLGYGKRESLKMEVDWIEKSQSIRQQKRISAQEIFNQYYDSPLVQKVIEYVNNLNANSLEPKNIEILYSKIKDKRLIDQRMHLLKNLINLVHDEKRDEFYKDINDSILNKYLNFDMSDKEKYLLQFNDNRKILSDITEKAVRFYVKSYDESCDDWFIQSLRREFQENLGYSLTQIDEVVLRSLIGRYKSQRDFNTYLYSNIEVTNLNNMTGEMFELFLEELFEDHGFEVMLTKGSGDQGVDLILDDCEKRIAVQAKRYSTSVNNKAIQEVVAGMKYYNCQEAWVVTTNYFNESAIALAKANNVKLIDKDELEVMISDSSLDEYVL